MGDADGMKDIPEKESEKVSVLHRCVRVLWDHSEVLDKKHCKHKVGK